jgi:hypothetical protein
VVIWLGIVSAPMVLWYSHTVRATLVGYHLPETDRIASSIPPRSWQICVWFIVYGLSIALVRSRAVRMAFTNPISGVREA